jgi:GT2 family glycosyltransferase
MNIVIPCRKYGPLLKKAINEILKQNEKNFVISIISESKINIKNSKIKIFKVRNKLNMSAKRNAAVRKINSKYIFFMDSDAFPQSKDLLKKAINILEKNKSIIMCGGPDIVPKKIEKEAIVPYLLKPYFISGLRTYLKEKKGYKYVKQLTSCNMFMRRKDYIKLNGMNEKYYTGEDADLCNKIINKNLNIYYSQDLAVYHQPRNFKNFIIQRIDRSHEAAKATKIFIKSLIMKKGNKYTVKTFRYEFLINFFLPLLWTVLIIFFLFLKKNILLLALILIPITILFFETLRVTGLKKNFSKVLLGLSSAILVQVIMNFYFFFFKDSFLKNNYFNVNDSEISNI